MPFPYNEVRMPEVPPIEEILTRVADEFVNAAPRNHMNRGGSGDIYVPHLGRDWSNQTQVNLALRTPIRHLVRRMEEQGIVGLSVTDHNPDTQYWRLTDYGRDVMERDQLHHLILWPGYTVKASASAIWFLLLQTPNGDEGSATAIRLDDGRFATCAHCLEGATDARLSASPEGNRYRIDSYDVHDSADCAVLYCPDAVKEQTAVIEVGDEDAEYLDDILVFHYPSVAMRLPALVITRGELNGKLTAYDGGCDYMLISARTARGSSGGAVVARDGTLAGMVVEQTYTTGSTQAGGPESDVFYHALPSRYVRELLNGT